MEKITITYDKVGNTLDVWFEKPRPCINEELGNGVIIKKDESGEIIGFVRRINGTVLFIFDCINLWGQPSKLTLRNVLLLRQTAERRIERIIAKVFDRKDKFRYNHERRYYDQN